MKDKIVFGASILTALIFLLTCWIWAYLANLIIGLPFGLLSFYLWKSSRNSFPMPWRNLPVWLLGAGVIAALIALVIVL